MEQTLTHQDRIGVITLSGRFDAVASPLFDDWFNAADQPDNNGYLLDLAEVPYITSAGLRSLLKLVKLLEGRNGRLALCCVAQPVQDLFKMSGFAAFLNLHDSKEAALAALLGP